jgi:FtsP/CotA-like multicopper oxidase with cupredoxin domain
MDTRTIRAAVPILVALALLAPSSRGSDGDPAPVRVPDPARDASPERSGAGYRSVVTPNGATLPYRTVDGVKVFHLVAEEVRHEFAPGLVGRCWGYNGRVHGPTIEAIEGDRVRIYVSNRLPAPTTVHWHGLHVPNGMDGVAGLTQRTIEPGETFRYEFTLTQHGTFMYHPHHDEMVQMALGMMGMFVVHPRNPTEPPADRDFVYLLSEWAMKPGVERPDPNEMTDFNVLTFNAKVFPATEPLVVKRGDRVRIRIGNLSGMDHHPIHLHGHSFRVVETDGGRIPEAGRWPETSVLVPTGSTRVVEFVADNPGDWPIHCHMTHHTMTQMGHEIPNLIGVDQSDFDQAVFDAMARGRSTSSDAPTEIPMEMPKNSVSMLGGPGPFGYVTMGGMFAILKVRDGLETYADPGWYQHPAGTVAGPADPSELARDGVEVPPPAIEAAPAPRTDGAGAPPPPPRPEGSPTPSRHGHGGHR